MSALPLEGVRVLDLSRIIAGPNCTMQLADMGAEVIKVEVPGSGDDSRRMKPPEVGGEGHFYLAFNRNKKSIAIDMKTDAGRDLVLKVAASSDVFVENFRPGVAKRLGVDYETLRELNPRLVYCCLRLRTGRHDVGPTGPRSRLSGGNGADVALRRDRRIADAPPALNHRLVHQSLRIYGGLRRRGRSKGDRDRTAYRCVVDGRRNFGSRQCSAILFHQR